MFLELPKLYTIMIHEGGRKRVTPLYTVQCTYPIAMFPKVPKCALVIHEGGKKKKPRYNVHI